MTTTTALFMLIVGGLLVLVTEELNDKWNNFIERKLG